MVKKPFLNKKWFLSSCFSVYIFAVVAVSVIFELLLSLRLKLLMSLRFPRCCCLCFFGVVSVSTLFRCLLFPVVAISVFFRVVVVSASSALLLSLRFPPLFRCLHFPRFCGVCFFRVVAMSLRFPLVAVAESSAWLLFLGRLDLYVYFTI